MEKLITKAEIAELTFAAGRADANRLIFGKRVYRKMRAAVGWPNWYINRGRMSRDPSKSERRRVSWRRAH